MGEDIMDYNDRCRLCIAGAKRLSIDIFSPEGKRSKLQSKISKYLSLKVFEDDKLPSSICYQCLFRLETWVSFKKHCLDSDQTLKNWAFFCGAITPESYLIEANKSSENGSDVEKLPSSYSISKDDDARKHRTPPPAGHTPARETARETAPGPSHTPSRTVSPSPSAPLSSSSSTSSHRRGSESHDRSAAKPENSPLNGVTRPLGIRPSKSGRRKILRPTKAFTSTRNEDSPVQLITLERKATRKSEDANLPKELPQKETSPTLTLPFKRKRGRPSKAWLRERAEALKKLKDAQTQQESPEKEEEEPEVCREEPKQVQEVKEPKEIKKESIEKEESKEKKAPKSKGMTEMIELDDPDFGSMKFTLSVIDSSAVPSSEKTLVYPESSSSGRLSADSCLKEEFSGFPNVKAQEDPAKTPVEDRLSKPCTNEISELPSLPEKSDRKRSLSALGHRSSEEREEKMSKVEATSRSSESPKEDDGIAAAVTALRRSSSDQLKTEDDESDAEVVTGDETNLDESYVQDGGPLEEDSDSDNGPPMSPLSPARIHFEVIDVGEAQEVEIDRSDNYEY